MRHYTRQPCLPPVQMLSADNLAKVCSDVHTELVWPTHVCRENLVSAEFVSDLATARLLSFLLTRRMMTATRDLSAARSGVNFESADSGGSSVHMSFVNSMRRQKSTCVH